MRDLIRDNKKRELDELGCIFDHDRRISLQSKRR